MADTAADLIALTQKLLNAISDGDWSTYADLCSPDLTAYEPEAPGQMVVGLEFHRFYFNLGGVRGPHLTTMCSPNVRMLGDVAIVCYARLIQRVGLDGKPLTVATTETRVWHKVDGKWKHVHFHRSGN